MRQSWDAYFMSLAKAVVAARATCHRAKHGALIVKSKNIISIGYNGAPMGIEDCRERNICRRERLNIKPGTCYELCDGSHAEMNAITFAARHGGGTEGATLYITGLPCLICSKLIINAGIARVVYDNTLRYDDMGSLNLMTFAGLVVEPLEKPAPSCKHGRKDCLACGDCLT